MRAVVGVALIGALSLFTESLAALALLTTAFAVLLIVLAVAVFAAALYGMISTTIRSRGRASWTWLGFIVGGSILYGLPTLAVYALMGGHTELETNQMSAAALVGVFVCFFWWLVDVAGIFGLYVVCYTIADDQQSPRGERQARRATVTVAGPTYQNPELARWYREKYLRFVRTSVVLYDTDPVGGLIEVWFGIVHNAPDAPGRLKWIDEYKALSQSLRELGYTMHQGQRISAWSQIAAPGYEILPEVWNGTW